MFVLKVNAEGRTGVGRAGESMGDFIRRTGGSIVGATNRTRGRFAPVSNQRQRGRYAGQPNRMTGPYPPARGR